MIKETILFLLCLMLIGTASAETLEESAQWCKDHAYNQDQFFEFLIQEVNSHIKYKEKPGWEVFTPEVAWQKGYGDCSERSVVLVKMLESQGYDAQYIWGTLNKNLHARVLVGLPGKNIYLDTSDPRFKGEWEFKSIGMHPEERLVTI